MRLYVHRLKPDIVHAILLDQICNAASIGCPRQRRYFAAWRRLKSRWQIIARADQAAFDRQDSEARHVCCAGAASRRDILPVGRNGGPLELFVAEPRRRAALRRNLPESAVLRVRVLINHGLPIRRADWRLDRITVGELMG